MKVGDRVDYHPRDLSDIDEPIEDTIIIKLLGPDSIFNQQMAIIEGVDHWIPARDLSPVGGGEPVERSIIITLCDDNG